MDETPEKLGAAKWSIAVNIFATAMKLSVALYTGSLGILAEVIHSGFDLVASLFAYWGIRKAGEPADDEHHYGHERFENLSSLAQSVLIALTSFWILYEAYRKLTGEEHAVKESLAGIAVMLVSLVLATKVSDYLHKKSRETGSPALEADAYHFTTDVMSTLAVILGLGATALGFPVADVLAAVAVALIMLYLSFRLGKKAVLVLLDEAPDDLTMEKVVGVLAEFPKIRGYHSLRGRVSGHKAIIDVSVHVAPYLTIEEAHAVAEELEMKIVDDVPDVKEVEVHVEPETPHDTGRAVRTVFD